MSKLKACADKRLTLSLPNKKNCIFSLAKNTLPLR